MRAVAPLLALALLVSGCAGGTAEGEAPDTSGPSTPGADGEESIPEAQADAPQWRLGQGWRYVVDVPGQKTRTFTMLVAEDLGDVWVVASDDRDQAVHHALYSTNPMMGRQAKETLSPFQSGVPVRLLDFPLTDGKQWSAPFFGETMTFTARFAGDILLEPSVGLGAFVEGFRIEARGPSGLRVDYTYVEAVQWFTFFEIRDPGGQRVIRTDLIGVLEDVRGPYVFLRGEDLLVRTLTSEPLGPVFETLDVPAPERFHEGLAAGLVYTGRATSVPPFANVTLIGPPDDTAYWSVEFSGLGQKHRLGQVPVPAACLDPDDPSCAGPLRLEVRLTGEVDLQVNVASLLVLVEGER